MKIIILALLIILYWVIYTACYLLVEHFFPGRMGAAFAIGSLVGTLWGCAWTMWVM